MLKSLFKPKPKPGHEEAAAPPMFAQRAAPTAATGVPAATPTSPDVTNEWGAPLIDFDAEFIDLVSRTDEDKYVQQLNAVSQPMVEKLLVEDDGTISLTKTEKSNLPSEQTIIIPGEQKPSPTQAIDKITSELVPFLGRKPSNAASRILHLHIPKTAGTALRGALAQAKGGSYRIFPDYDETRIQSAVAAEWDLFSGHFGYKTAASLGGDIVTVLRHPVERFVSVYYFWRELLRTKVEVSRSTQLTHSYDLEDFVSLIDELPLLQEFYNRMTWQIAHGSSIEHRSELRDKGKTDDDILALALENLRSFAVVGLQNRLPEFCRALERRYNFTVTMDMVNVTDSRPDVWSLPVRTRKRILNWLELDMELYHAACNLLTKSA